MSPALDGIDHIHVYVSDREQAAAWYERVLGFTIIDKLAFWANDPRGPLTIYFKDPDNNMHEITT